MDISHLGIFQDNFMSNCRNCQSLQLLLLSELMSEKISNWYHNRCKSTLAIQTSIQTVRLS